MRNPLLGDPFLTQDTIAKHDQNRFLQIFIVLMFRLNVDNLEKEVNSLKSSVSATQKKLEKAPDDVKQQMGKFIEVTLFTAKQFCKIIITDNYQYKS